jgi:hypothetical protein
MYFLDDKFMLYYMRLKKRRKKHGGFTGGALKSCYFSHVKKVEGQAAFRLVISFVSERQTQRVTADKMVAYQIKLAEKTAEKVRYGF